MACPEIASKTSFTIKFEGFRDRHAAAGVFLDAATTAEATIWKISVRPNVQIGGTVPLVFQSDGDYWGEVAHDFASSGIVKGIRIAIRAVMEEGAVHSEPDEDVYTVA